MVQVGAAGSRGERPGLDDQLLSTTHLPQTPEDLAELGRLETARDARHAFGDLEEQPEEQRLREWTAYVEALKTRVEAMAATTPRPQRARPRECRRRRVPPGCSAARGVLDLPGEPPG
jgi:hypothetical protein